MNMDQLKVLLDQKVVEFNSFDFIESDPISIPHQFSKKQDIEIAGFFAATLAWGQRKTIINKCNELIELMDHAPHQFMVGHQEHDLKKLLAFKHRTFNTTDLLYFIEFFKHFYQQHESLEYAFLPDDGVEENIESGLINFYNHFFSLADYPRRTIKHVSSPAKKSACKRLNMYLRWMVRNDDKNVDFGIWSKLQSSDLICPLDVHVDRVARSLGLIQRKQTDWLTALELTRALRLLDPDDPVKYDYALFGMGVIEKF